MAVGADDEEGRGPKVFPPAGMQLSDVGNSTVREEGKQRDFMGG